MRALALLLIVGCASTTSAPPPETKAHVHTGLAAGLANLQEIKERMKKVATALGVQCDHCHDVADFSAPTVHKRIANMMLAEFVMKLEASPGGEALNCRTCHDQKATFLDRSDEEALKKWMKENYVERLRMKGTGAPIECATCHGESRFKFLPRSL